MQRAEGMSADSTMLRKVLMRARTDRKEPYRSKSKAPRVRTWSMSTSPEGGGTDDHQYPCVTGPQQRKTTDARARQAVTRRSGPGHVGKESEQGMVCGP